LAYCARHPANYLSSYLFDIQPHTHQTPNAATPKNKAGTVSTSYPTTVSISSYLLPF